MDKKITDYLHLYLGCEVEWWNGSGVYVLDPYYLSEIAEDDLWEKTKPILRPLSDMTEEEMKELWKIVFNRTFPPSGRIESSYLQDKRNPRWILMSGVERLGIQLNGDIWADSDLHNWPMNPHLNTLYMLKKHFDLFGLIEAGLAIDKTKQ